MKHFNPFDKKGKRALDDLSKWLGKHDLTMLEMMEIFSSFMGYAAVKSGDPVAFMKDLIELLKHHITRHLPKSPERC